MFVNIPLPTEAFNNTGIFNFTNILPVRHVDDKEKIYFEQFILLIQY